MNWEALGAIAELLGAIGVIATLVYLSIQVKVGRDATEANTLQLKQNEKTAAAQMRVSLVSMMLEVNRDVYSSDELAELLAQVAEQGSDEQLSPAARARVFRFWITEMNRYRLQYYLLKDGILLGDDYASNLEIGLSHIMRNRAYRAFWMDGASERFPIDFAGYVNQLLERIDSE